MKEVCSRNGGTSMKYKHKNKKINIFNINNFEESVVFRLY